ncbi:MAG TPA: zinc-ribbon domain-containing protein [Allocoleopsis sp.]
MLVALSRNAIACTSCGKENPSGARFCSRCGVSLAQFNPLLVQDYIDGKTYQASLDERITFRFVL